MCSLETKKVLGTVPFSFLFQKGKFLFQSVTFKERFFDFLFFVSYIYKIQPLGSNGEYIMSANISSNVPAIRSASI